MNSAGTQVADVIGRLMMASGKKTQKDLAAELHTTSSTISGWKARGVVPMEWIYRAAHIFRVSPDWLIRGEIQGGARNSEVLPGLTVLDISGAAISVRITLPEDQQLIGIVYSDSGINQLREYVCRPVIRPWLNEHGEFVSDLESVPFVIRRSAADDLGDWLAMVAFRATEALGPILPGDWLLIDTDNFHPVAPNIYLIAVGASLLIRRFEVAVGGGVFVAGRSHTPSLPGDEVRVLGEVLERAGPIRNSHF